MLISEPPPEFWPCALKLLFLKTVLKKAIEFYDSGIEKMFYEWIFKFRNYIEIIDKDFDFDNFIVNHSCFNLHTFQV